MSGKRKEWVDFPVTEETAKKYGWRAPVLLDDCWLSGYKALYGRTPLRPRISAEGVMLDFIDFEQRKVTRIARYPREGMTFADVWRWLHTTPDSEVVCVEKIGGLPE